MAYFRGMGLMMVGEVIEDEDNGFKIVEKGVSYKDTEQIPDKDEDDEEENEDEDENEESEKQDGDEDEKTEGDEDKDEKDYDDEEKNKGWKSLYSAEIYSTKAGLHSLPIEKNGLLLQTYGGGPEGGVFIRMDGKISTYERQWFGTLRFSPLPTYQYVVLCNDEDGQDMIRVIDGVLGADDIGDFHTEYEVKYLDMQSWFESHPEDKEIVTENAFNAMFGIPEND